MNESEQVAWFTVAGVCFAAVTVEKLLRWTACNAKVHLTAHCLVLQPQRRAMAAFITASRIFVIVAYLTFLWALSAIVHAVVLSRMMVLTEHERPINAG